MTKENTSSFKNRVIVLHDMGHKFNSFIKYYFTEGRHYNVQMIVMCHKPAQINNLARLNCDTIYITTYNGADLFSNFNTNYGCNHNFHKIIRDLNSSQYNFTN